MYLLTEKFSQEKNMFYTTYYASITTLIIGIFTTGLHQYNDR